MCVVIQAEKRKNKEADNMNRKKKKNKQTIEHGISNNSLYHHLIQCSATTASVLCLLIHIGCLSVTETAFGEYDCVYDESFTYPRQHVDGSGRDVDIDDGGGMLKCFLCRVVLGCCAMACKNDHVGHKLLCYGCCCTRNLLSDYDRVNLLDDSLPSECISSGFLSYFASQYGSVHVSMREDFPTVMNVFDSASSLTSCLLLDIMKQVFLSEHVRSSLKMNHNTVGNRTNLSKKFDEGKSYFTFVYDSVKCVSSPCVDLMHTLIKCIAGWNLPDMIGFENGRGILIMLGFIGTFTGLHLDQSGAWTVAFKVWTSPPSVEDIESSMTQPLAWWLFINASIKSIELVNKFLSLKENEDILKVFPLIEPPSMVCDGVCVFGGISNKCGKLTVDFMRRIVAGVGSDHVFMLSQCNGEIIHPTPGYMHYVLNVDIVLKVAVECVEPKSYVRTSISLTKLAPIFGQLMASDYTSFYLSRLSEVSSAINSLLKKKCPLNLIGNDTL